MLTKNKLEKTDTKKIETNNDETKTTETKTTETKTESLVGYMVIKDNTVYFDEVEIVETEDKERVEELGLSDTDMPNGYIIINQSQEEATFDLSDEVVYTFTDMALYFVTEPDGKRQYTTTKKEEFLKHLGKLNTFPLSEQKIPYFVQVQDGKIISITEEFLYTV